MAKETGRSLKAIAEETGIDEKQLRKFSALAEIPSDVREEFFQQLRADEDPITTSALLKLWKRRQRQKSKLDSFLRELSDVGWVPGLTPESYQRIIDAGFRGKNLSLAAVAAEIAYEEHPITLRGLFYRVVSAGWLPSTDKEHYSRLGRVMTTLREAGIIPFDWIVDNLRSTVKPSSWSGIGDFADTVRDAYRMDFWSQLPKYVHIFCEKDAIAGVLAPVTKEFDVALSPVRGYCSLSFAHEVADTWNRIDKPIFAYYLGDFDPSGFDIERDLEDKLRRYCHHHWTYVFENEEVGPKEVSWTRLAVNDFDLDEFDLLPLAVKKSDNRAAAFIRNHGDRCAELDALPATELRRRVREAIEQHIPSNEWERLKEHEQQERESFNAVLDKLGGAA